MATEDGPSASDGQVWIIEGTEQRPERFFNMKTTATTTTTTSAARKPGEATRLGRRVRYAGSVVRYHRSDYISKGSGDRAQPALQISTAANNRSSGDRDSSCHFLAVRWDLALLDTRRAYRDGATAEYSPTASTRLSPLGVASVVARSVISMTLLQADVLAHAVAVSSKV